MIPLRLVGDGESTPVSDLVERFLEPYQNPGTRAGKRSKLISLFAATGATHPEQITESHLHAWCTGNGTTIANNSVRQRVSEARTFFAWCMRNGHTSSDVAADLLAMHSPLKKYRKVYGKQQGKHPGRCLIHDEAFGTLLTVSRDGTPAGLRDELVIRLGLLGLRQVEIACLVWENLDQLPRVHWIGKGHAPRRTTAGMALLDVIDRYRKLYQRATGPVHATWPVVCKATAGAKARHNGRPLAWGQPVNPTNGVFHIVNTVGHAAGLGHIAPHDLRRSAAGVLHNSVDEHGEQFFDLLDIQRVLGHSDPATTMRSYLNPMDNAVIDRAAAFLD